MDKINLLLSKLRQPVHISFIASNILREPIGKTKEILDGLKNEGIIEESDLAKGYFHVSSKTETH
jgi:hypothetical protein